MPKDKILRDIYGKELDPCEEFLLVWGFLSIGEKNWEDRLEKIINSLSVSPVKKWFQYLKAFLVKEDHAKKPSFLKPDELILFKEWNELLRHLGLRRSLGVSEKKLRFSASFKEFCALCFIFFVVIVGVKFGDRLYKKHLLEKITLLEPYFFWQDKQTKYREPVLSETIITLNKNEIETIESAEKNEINFDQEAQNLRFEVESDVVISDFANRTKSFSEASLAASSYEEDKKGGYRNSNYGRNRAYRVMMTSVNPQKAKQKLLGLIKQYNAKNYGQVEPGKEIPGGVYFNLYIPEKKSRDFISAVDRLAEVIVYESRTPSKAPKGMDKVFVWVKQI